MRSAARLGILVAAITLVAAGFVAVSRNGAGDRVKQVVANPNSFRELPTAPKQSPRSPTAEPAPSPAPSSGRAAPKEVLWKEHDFSREAGKTIEVDIAKQQLTAWQDGVVVYRFKISTGRRGYATPTGTFKVRTKYYKRWSRKWKVWMPYAMFFHPLHGYAFHELAYKDGQPDKRIGASKLGRPDSHGCIRVNVGDAKRLYEWAPVGTRVWIH